MKDYKASWIILLDEVIASMPGYEISEYKSNWGYWTNVYIPIIKSPDGFEFPFAMIKYKYGSAILIHPRDFCITPKIIKRVEWFYRSDYSYESILVIRHHKTGDVINILPKNF